MYLGSPISQIKPPSTTDSGCCQCSRTAVHRPCCLEPIRSHNGRLFRPPDMLAVPPTVLDGENASEYVCPDSRSNAQRCCSLMHLTMIIVNLAWYFVLNQAPNARKPSPTKFYTAVALLVFATVIFRAEVLLILGPFVLHALWSGYATLLKTVCVVLISGLISLGKSYRYPLRWLSYVFQSHHCRRGFLLLESLAYLARTRRTLLQRLPGQ